MLSDWLPLALRVQQALNPSRLSAKEKSLVRDLIIANRRLHLKPEPEWKSLSEIPLEKGMSFEIKEGRIIGSLSQKISEISKLMKYLVAFFGNLIFSRKKSGLKNQKLTLFYSDGFNPEKRLEFIEFIEESRFNEIAHDRTLIIQDRNIWKSNKSGNHIFVKDIGLFVATNVLGGMAKVKLTYFVLKEFLSLNKTRRYSFLGAHRIHAENTIWNFLFTQDLDLKLVATNSYMELLPTPFYLADSFGIHRYMIWYSNNNFSIPSEDGDRGNDNRIDFACRTDVDTHFVWTNDFADSISTRNHEVEVRVVGSIMMYTKRKIDPLPGKFKLAVFDMTPWQGYPSNMYGSELFMQSFLEDIVIACSDFPEITIFLKPKRNFIRSGKRKLHSQRYLKLIDELVMQNQLELLDPSTNIYGLTEQMNLTLGFPFASPVIIGKESSKPSYYYNPEYSKTWKLRETMDGIKVISGRENLQHLIKQISQGGLQNP